MMTEILKDPALWALIIFVIPLLLKFPIAVALGGSALFVSWHWSLGHQMISYNFYAGIAKFPLLAIPFFILAGVIMEKAGIAVRIINLIKELVGSVTGGLAIATVGVATFWGAVSGSGPATVAALGLILIPGMAAAGYDKAFSAAVVSVSSGLAIVIPPSIAFIVYGVVTETSVSALFAAGVFPGIVVALFLMLFVYFISKKHGYHGEPRGGREKLLKAFKESFWGLLTPVIILGGMTIARPEETDTTAAEKALSYPAAAIPGIRINPRAATVAGPEPLTAPQKVATPTVAIASPPVTEPTSSFIRLMIRTAMPAFSIMTPAKIKKGMARRGNLAMPA
jgi:C4-dicarboxylate transporter DctM subunit